MSTLDIKLHFCTIARTGIHELYYYKHCYLDYLDVRLMYLPAARVVVCVCCTRYCYDV